jgi:hypothetical protein
MDGFVMGQLWLVWVWKWKRLSLLFLNLWDILAPGFISHCPVCSIFDHICFYLSVDEVVTYSQALSLLATPE